MKIADAYAATDPRQLLAEVQLTVRYADHHIGTFHVATTFPGDILADLQPDDIAKPVGARVDPGKIHDVHVAINGRLGDVAMAIHDELAKLERERA